MPGNDLGHGIIEAVFGDDHIALPAEKLSIKADDIEVRCRSVLGKLGSL